MNNYYPFVNTPLPYNYRAMEPYIDEKTMRLHHDKHLQTYIDNLNKILSTLPQLQKTPLEKLLTCDKELPSATLTSIRNNGGGVFNHRFYFSNLANPAPQQPTGLLAQRINKFFGSYDNFQQQLTAAALSVFGSGYAWLTSDVKGQLSIITTANQDTPLSRKLYPILNADVWEHAYYLKHYNVRAGYLKDWFRVVNWTAAEKNYLQSLEEYL